MCGVYSFHGASVANVRHKRQVDCHRSVIELSQKCHGSQFLLNTLITSSIAFQYSSKWKLFKTGKIGTPPFFLRIYIEGCKTGIVECQRGESGGAMKKARLPPGPFSLERWIRTSPPPACRSHQSHPHRRWSRRARGSPPARHSGRASRRAACPWSKGTASH